jgi:hypothetical protein
MRRKASVLSRPKTHKFQTKIELVKGEEQGVGKLAAGKKGTSEQCLKKFF